MKKHLWIFATVIIIIGVASAAFVLTRDAFAPKGEDSLQDPQPVIMEGKLTCLPHRNTEGAQTLECAYGLQTNEGVYYSLRDSKEDYSTISSVPFNEPVKVTGELEIKEDEKYNSNGIITVIEILQL